MLAEVRSNATDRRESQRVNQQKTMQRDPSGEVAEHLAAQRTGNCLFVFLSLNDYWMKSASIAVPDRWQWVTVVSMLEVTCKAPSNREFNFGKLQFWYESTANMSYEVVGWALQHLLLYFLLSRTEYWARITWRGAGVLWQVSCAPLDVRTWSAAATGNPEVEQTDGEWCYKLTVSCFSQADHVFLVWISEKGDTVMNCPISLLFKKAKQTFLSSWLY